MAGLDNAPPSSVLAAYGWETARLVPVRQGNINQTFRVTAAAEFILQRVNPIFAPEVHLDILAVTEHLHHRGLLTPRLIRARADALWVTDEQGGVWRALTFIPGEVLSQGASLGHCRAAAALLARFHLAVADLDHTFRHVRAGVHDTPRHRRALEAALASHARHAAFARVQPVAGEILARLDAVPALGPLPARVVHGDPKLNNVVFSAEGEARCFIDLDTLARMPVPVELGDAFRSWCNPPGEDRVDAFLDLERYEAGLAGYAETGRALLNADEVQAIPAAVELIALELAARFCADALVESYFAWDATRFASASAHNLHRAQSQLALARSIAAQRDALRRITDHAFRAR
jgi:Ser/Thr protein kinase RdoA (MazF antagonist)